MKKYYSLESNGESTDIYIYGDITSWPWMDGEMSAISLSRKIEEIESGAINIYINSYGGEVAEGAAIYNALKRHKAKVVTYCDGFACSAASVVFMAGDERIMYDTSLLMIHNAWTYAAGNAKELRKTADDLETISAAAANAYKSAITITDEELNELLDNETWIPADLAVSMGFATTVVTEEETEIPAANARAAIVNKLCGTAAKVVTVKLDAGRIEEIIEQKLKAATDKLILESGEKVDTNKVVNFLGAYLRRKGME